jgi:hypothetical protein
LRAKQEVQEAILPGGTVFQDSRPLFDTAPDLKQSAELLHVSAKGVNTSGRSTVSGAFASSLTESDGNGGVGGRRRSSAVLENQARTSFVSDRAVSMDADLRL